MDWTKPEITKVDYETKDEKLVKLWDALYLEACDAYPDFR